MATKAQVEELNANLTEAVTEIGNKVTELNAEIEALKAAQEAGEDINLETALGLSRQLKDVVQNVPTAEPTTEGQETQEGNLAGQE